MNNINLVIKKTAALFMFVLIVQNIPAYTWKNVVMMGGGFVPGLAYSPVQQNLLYARTDVGGLYRWNNSAGQWIPLTDMFTGSYMGGESIAPDPVNPNVVYAAVGFSGYGNILRSADQGNSWTAYPIAVSIAANNDGREAGERLAVDPNLASKLYFGSRWQGLWFSTNSAATWSQVAAFPASGDSGYGISWVIFPKPAGGYGSPSGTASQTIYAGVASLSSGNSNVYRTINGGTSWSIITGGPSGMTTPHASLGTDGYLWIVYDSGGYGPNGVSTGQIWKLNTTTLGWTNVTPSNGPPGGSGGYSGISVDPENAGHAVITTIDWWGGPDKLFSTSNGGTSWTIIALAGSSYSTFNDNGAVYTTACGSTQGGTGWAASVAIDPFNSNNAIYTSGGAAAGGGVWSSTNIQTSPVPWTFTDVGLEEGVAIYMNPSAAGGILFSCMGDFGGMRHTNPAQSPASGIYCNPQFSNTNMLDFAELNTNTVVRVGNANSSTGNDMAYSGNNGQTWTPWGSAPPGYTSNNQMGSVAIAADGSAVVVSPYSGYGSPAYASSLGGAWNTCSGLPSGACVAADRSTASTFYATSPSQWVYGGTVNIYRSTDYGKTFTQVNSIAVNWSDPNGNGQFVVPRPVFGMAGEFWVSTYNALYRFTNGGTSVTTISNVYEPMGPVGFGKAASGQPHPAVYLVGTVSGTYGFFRCDDGVGTAWTRINDASHQFGGPGWIQGDEQVYGRCYLGAGARGIIYGDIDATPTNTPVITSTFTPTRTVTVTFTRTVSASATASVSPINSYTRTPTASASASASPAITNTRTPSATASMSPQNTFSNTPTRTSSMSPTSTFSVTPQNTFSATASVSPSYTNTRIPTNTPTRTASVSPSYTNTRIPTNTPTRTASVSPSNTQTRTQTPTGTNTLANTATYMGTVLASATFTPTSSRTITGSPVITQTDTPSLTLSSTRTVSPSVMASGTDTPVFTLTYTPTRTSTPSFTSTRTASFTATATLTGTASPVFSPTESSTGTPSTSTSTPAITLIETITFTETYTASGTAVDTASFTPTQTATGIITATNTPFNTPVFSGTFTATVSVTVTITSTASMTFTSTYTRTCTKTATLTVTIALIPTATATCTIEMDDKMTVDDPVFYPNPFNMGVPLYLNFDVTRPADSITVEIYTTGFRKVLEDTVPGTFIRQSRISLPQYMLSKLANGIYYARISAKGVNEKAAAKLIVLIILK